MTGAPQQGQGDSEAESFTWPGNVRELQHAVMRAAGRCQGAQIPPEDLGLDSGIGAVSPPSLQVACREAERQVLAQTDGNVIQMAQILGTSRPMVYELLRTHGLDSKSPTGS